MRVMPTTVLLALSACTGVQGDVIPSPAIWIESGQVSNYEALSSVGNAPQRATVRAVNTFGAAISTTPSTDLRVDDSPVEVAFDGFGYGSITFESPGVVEIQGGNQLATVHTVDSTWEGVELSRAWQAPLVDPGFAVAVTTGLVGALGNEVVWAGIGAAPHRILAADGPILGLRALHVDVDGVLDVVAWSAGTVFLLRGRAGGGFGWGGALTATGLAVGAVDVGDLSEDNLPDLAIAWVGQEGTGVLDIWEGDGLFGFVAAEPRTVGKRPISLSISDNTGEGVPQITILTDDGGWIRFIRGAELKYMPIGPSAPVSVLLPRDATLLPTGDINDDDADEISVAGARTPGQGRFFWFFDVESDQEGCLSGDPEAQCTTEYLPLEDEQGAWVTLDDANGDLVTDILLLTDDQTLLAVSFDPEEIQGRYRKLSLSTLPSYGAIDMEDTDRDGSPDLFLAGGPYWWTWKGVSHGDLEEFWTPYPDQFESVREGLVAPWVFTELDNDPATIDIIGFGIETGDTVLKVLQYVPGTQRAAQIGDLAIDDAGVTPLDVAVCGSDVFVAVSGRVHLVSIANPAAPVLLSSSGATVDRLDCGVGPNGANVAVLEGAQVRLLTRPGLVEVGTIPAAGAFDVAMADVGAGPEVRTCATEGCTIVPWVWGDAGEALFARADADGVSTIDALGAETAIGGGGALSTGDIDDDGHLDLLSLRTSDGLVSVHRSTGVSIGPAEIWHSARPLAGVLGIADADLDGRGDVFALDTVGDLTFLLPVMPASTTTSTGTTPPSTPTSTDTGDTGTP